jgi:transposase
VQEDLHISDHYWLSEAQIARVKPYFPRAHGVLVLTHLTAGQVSDYSGARKLLDNIPAAKHLLADRGYDANWFREGLLEKEITPCILPRKTGNTRLGVIKHGINKAIRSKTCLDN